MRKQIALITVTILIIFLSLNVQAAGAPSMTLTWDPPTFKTLNGDCAIQGDPVTAADLTRIIYEIAYRVTGATTWTKFTATTNTATITNLAWSASYDIVVGAKWGTTGAVTCLTDIVIYVTGPEPTPGKCSNLKAK